MTRILCVDVDNTLGDYTNALRMFVWSCRDLHSYPCPDFLEYDCSTTPGWPFTGDGIEYRRWHELAVANGLYVREQPYAGAADVLTVLHDAGWRIIVSTSRRDDTRGSTRRWLEANDIPYDGVHYGDKLDIRFDVLIDDRPDTLARAMRLDGVRVLHPNHEYCVHAPGMGFDRWADVPRLLGVES